MRCHASISYTVAPENIPIFACNEEDCKGKVKIASYVPLKALKRQKCKVKMSETLVWKSVSGLNKCKMVLGTNTKTWKMRNPYDVTGKLGSDQMGGG